MTHEYLTLANGPTTGFGWPAVGVMLENGGKAFFGILEDMTAQSLENTGNLTTWMPYDRGIVVPSPGYWTDSRYGVLFWNQNQILRRNGIGGWQVEHTVVGQENVIDYGRHGGLYATIGSDGRLYVCGMATGNTGATYMSYVVYDVEADTWYSGEQDVGARAFLMNECFIWRNRLLYAHRNGIYQLDPAAKKITYTSLGWGATNNDDRLAVVGQRLLMIGRRSGRLYVHDLIGGTAVVEIADLGQITVNAIGWWDYLQDGNSLFFFFNSVEGLESGYRCVEFKSLGQYPGDLVSTTERTNPVLWNLTSLRFHTDLNSTPNGRLFTAQDVNQGDGTALANLYTQNGGTYTEDWVAYRFVDEFSSISNITIGPGGSGHTYIAGRTGLGPNMFITQQKIVAYEVSSAEEIVAGGLSIKFWLFDNVSQNVSVRIRYQSGSPVSNQTGGNPNAIGFIHSVVSGGVLNPSLQQVDNCPMDNNGGGAHEIIFDRVSTQNLPDANDLNWYLEII